MRVDFGSSATQRAWDACAVFFGGGNFTKEEKEFFKKFNFSDDQILSLHGNDKVLAKLYENASALIYPSIYEGFGLPILEAMNHNCPVISSNTSSMKEVGGNAVEYFNPHETESLLQAFKNVLYSESRRKELVKLGIERIKTFSWNKCAKETLKVYGRLC